MTYAYLCEVCTDVEAWWRIERRGDAMVTWACPAHLSQACRGAQRDWEEERTELVVTMTVPS